MAHLLRLIFKPNDIAQVVGLNEALTRLASPGDFDELVGSVGSKPGIAERFRLRARLDLTALPALGELPSSTLGGAYARFLQENAIDPSVFPRREIRTDADYMIVHMYETHDLWHVLTGFDTTVEGELGLQGFMAAQFFSPFSWLLIAGGLLNLAFFARARERSRFEAIVAGYVMGRRAHCLVGMDWNALWGASLEAVRGDFRITEAQSWAFFFAGQNPGRGPIEGNLRQTSGLLS